MRPSALAKIFALLLLASSATVAGVRALNASDAGFFARIALDRLPAEEFRLVEFLLLLPVAGLVIAVFRNIVGLPSFGTFAPVLIGLAFRHLESWPGIVVFVAVLVVGWGLRRLLEPFHLLEVPRASLLLSVVVVGLVGLVRFCHARQVPVTHYISLFPLVILTGIIERLWAMEAEDGAWASLVTLVGTLIISLCVSLVLALPGLVRTLVHYPEFIGLFMAGQLLLGRYTGYRLNELLRFRALLHDEPAAQVREVRRTIAVGPMLPGPLQSTYHEGLDVTSALGRKR